MKEPKWTCPYIDAVETKVESVLDLISISQKEIKNGKYISLPTLLNEIRAELKGICNSHRDRRKALLEKIRTNAEDLRMWGNSWKDKLD